MTSGLKRLSKFLLMVFVISVLISIAVILFPDFFFPADPTIPAPSGESQPLITFLVSIMSAVISLIGFVVTTTLSLRREKREAREAELIQKQKEIELEKAQLELEKLKKQIGKKKK